MPQATYCSCSRVVHVTHSGRTASSHRQTTTNQPYATPVCRLIVSTCVIHVITWITTHLPTTKGWNAELAWLVDILRIPYQQSSHMSTIDQASPPAKDRRPNHWAMPPTNIINIMHHSSLTRSLSSIRSLCWLVAVGLKTDQKVYFVTEARPEIL